MTRKIMSMVRRLMEKGSLKHDVDLMRSGGAIRREPKQMKFEDGIRPFGIRGEKWDRD